MILAIILLAVSVVLAIIARSLTSELFALWAIAVAVLAPALRSLFN